MCLPALRAQDTLVATEPLLERSMMKKKKFSFNTNIMFWMPTEPKDNSEYRMRYGGCVGALWGLRFGIDVTPHYTMGFGVDLSGEKYAIRQDETKNFVDDIQYDKELLRTNTLQFAYTHRFKLNKGIRSTWFLELGVYGVWVYDQNRKLLVNEYDAESRAKKIKHITVERKLDYTQAFHWGARVTIGYRYVALFAQYRFNDLVNFGSSQQDLPRLSFGLAIFGKPTKF
jgi:hypothetical protein